MNQPISLFPYLNGGQHVDRKLCFTKGVQSPLKNCQIKIGDVFQCGKLQLYLLSSRWVVFDTRDIQKTTIENASKKEG
ncbi:hypothetical protein TNCT_650911 [Trichonephila clavata]|uniref:Uncharacterized protein n=1 Tax=Trichonephila clavata TaxID=2740835 RepID=A0A8X6FZT3_TRICU|nr:hypothetical protein TNCT_650911 [Trichonephila clavata]